MFLFVGELLLLFITKKIYLDDWNIYSIELRLMINGLIDIKIKLLDISIK